MKGLQEGSVDWPVRMEGSGAAKAKEGLDLYPKDGTRRNREAGANPKGASSGLKVSVIIPAQNEQRKIGLVVREAQRLHPWEVLVIVNGSTDRTGEEARRNGASTLTFPEPLGTDVGRAIGAYAATGDVLLFIDGDFVIPWKDLLPFVEAAALRCDVALNNLEHQLYGRQPWNVVTTQKLSLNMALGREELKNSSLVPVPFALNRRALDVIPWTTLLCPPLAYAHGVLGGLRIEAVHTVEVDRLNRYRPYKHDNAANQHSIAAMQIIGDHFEALYEVSRILTNDSR